jgi:hypothetical protein
MSGLRVVLASWPDEDELVAEIWSGDDYVGDVRRRGARLRLTLAPAPSAGEGLDLGDFLAVLAAAQRHFEAGRQSDGE